MKPVPETVTSFPLLEELEWRGLLYQTTEGCAEFLAKAPVTGYCGFDPTAESLHVGNLVSIMGLVRLARAGHTAIALVGGGTAMIGDPSGKSEERPMRSFQEVRANARLIESQLRRIASAALGEVAEARFLIRDNAKWLTRKTLITFLRDVGKHFSVNVMMQKESVKSRLDGGISFTEFSYMLLQAYDFLKLYEMEGVTLQLGGSDQWGNITAGTELIRRAGSNNARLSPATPQSGWQKNEVHGLTFPLLTDSAGKKLGKTEMGAVWLDADRTTPYQFYQFWINCEDAMVGRFLRTFTLLNRVEIQSIEAKHASAPHERAAQKRLAHEVTSLVHGAEATIDVEEASDVLFGNTRTTELTARSLKILERELSVVQIDTRLGETLDVVDLFTRSKMCASKAEARRLLAQGGMYINKRRVSLAEPFALSTELIRGEFLLLRKGARHYMLLRVVHP